jgi:hypothetical protein
MHWGVVLIAVQVLAVVIMINKVTFVLFVFYLQARSKSGGRGTCRRAQRIGKKILFSGFFWREAKKPENKYSSKFRRENLQAKYKYNKIHGHSVNEYYSFIHST